MDITFDSLVTSVNERFQSLNITLGEGEVVVFENPLRREAEGRAAYRASMAALEAVFADRKSTKGVELAEGEEAPEGDAAADLAEEIELERKLVAGYSEALAGLCVSDNFEKATALLGEDTYLWTELFTAVMKNLKVGEA